MSGGNRLEALGARWGQLARSTSLSFSQALAVELIYRWPLVQGLLSIVVTAVGLILFWLAAGSAAQKGALYNANTLAGYFLVASCLSAIHENRLAMNLSLGIRMGKLSAGLIRPYPFLLGQFAQVAAQSVVRLAVAIPIMVGLAFVVPNLRGVFMAATSETLGLFVMALILGLFIGWCTKAVIGLLAFDLTQTWGPELIYISLYAAASGIGYPPDLIQEPLATALPWLPVYYLIGFPSMILLGHVPIADVWVGLGRGAMVLASLAILMTVMWRRGMRRFEAIGL